MSVYPSLENAAIAEVALEDDVADLSRRLIIIPLSFLRRLDSLKYTSVVALISIGYLVILVFAHFAKGDTMQDRGDLRIFTWEGPVAVLSSFPVIVFAYTCHQNVRLQLPLLLCQNKDLTDTFLDVCHSQ